MADFSDIAAINKILIYFINYLVKKYDKAITLDSQNIRSRWSTRRRQQLSTTFRKTHQLTASLSRITNSSRQLFHHGRSRISKPIQLTPQILQPIIEQVNGKHLSHCRTTQPLL